MSDKHPDGCCTGFVAGRFFVLTFDSLVIYYFVFMAVIKVKRGKISLSQAKTEARKLRKKLKQEKIPVQAMYLFGSCSRGLSHLDSDIDVAILLSSNLGLWERRKIRRIPLIAKQVNVRLEPHVISTRDFANRFLSLPAEIKKYGVKV